MTEMTEEEYWKLRRQHEADKRAEWEKLKEWQANQNLELFKAWLNKRKDDGPSRANSKGNSALR